jgi:hypothetical protein
MEGGDSRGCVANTPGGSSVYFQEGDACPPPPPFDFGDSGHVSGMLLCSTQVPTTALDGARCPINKAETFYPVDAAGCPQP